MKYIRQTKHYCISVYIICVTPELNPKSSTQRRWSLGWLTYIYIRLETTYICTYILDDRVDHTKLP